jgi:arginine decarboxylase
VSGPDESLVLPITIRTAAASGRTALSAFDAALLGAGVANFNLVRLSSVIPQRSRISFDSTPLPGEHGDRLYAVWASALAEVPGETVWAGIGWVRDPSGRGLFVEHTAATEKTVLELIELSLEDLSAHRGGGYGPIQSVTVAASHEGRPACALAIATYNVAGWELT